MRPACADAPPSYVALPECEQVLPACSQSGVACEIGCRPEVLNMAHPANPPGPLLASVPR